MLPLHRAFLPACLTLGALLCALPAPADLPTAPVVVGRQAHTIALQHTLPGEIIKVMHWGQATSLPAGVMEIHAVPETNSLAVTATPAGFAEVQQLVKILDFTPRQVQIKLALASASAADLKASGVVFEVFPTLSPGAFLQYMSGKEVASLFQTVTKRGAVVQPAVITTTNNVGATFSVSSRPEAGIIASSLFAVTPRVNSEDSVTLALHAVFTNGAVKSEIQTLRTVKSGEMMVIVMPSDAMVASGKNILLFATPTVLKGEHP